MVGLGLFENLSIEDYHGDTSSVSRSGLMAFKKSPFHYWAEYLNPNKPPKEPTEAMIFGNAFHTFMLENETFDSRYYVKPEQMLLRELVETFGKEDGRTRYELQKAWYDDFMSKSSHKTILNEKQVLTLHEMAQALKNHTQAMSTIEGGKFEQSLFWKDKETGQVCKVRPDIWHPNLLGDLKTITSADERTFQRAMVDHGYHIQAAMTREGVREVVGIDIENFVFIVCEKAYPYCVVPYIIDEESMNAGHAEFKRLLHGLKACKDANNWPGYETKTVGLPSWALNQ